LILNNILFPAAKKKKRKTWLNWTRAKSSCEYNSLFSVIEMKL
jgi:hypothetical protein